MTSSRPQPNQTTIGILSEKIVHELLSLTHLEIITALGDPTLEIDPGNSSMLETLHQISYFLRTSIGLDGSKVDCPPKLTVDNVILKKYLSDRHKENVESAPGNWILFITTLLQAINHLCDLTGSSDSVAFQKLNLPLF